MVLAHSRWPSMADPEASAANHIVVIRSAPNAAMSQARTS